MGVSVVKIIQYGVAWGYIIIMYGLYRLSLKRPWRFLLYGAGVGFLMNSPYSFLRFGLYGIGVGLTAAICGAVYLFYISWVYSLEEIKEKTKVLRASLRDDAPNMEEYPGGPLNSAEAKAVEVYLLGRSYFEESLQVCREPSSDKLLPDLDPAEQNTFTLVLDLHKTLLCHDFIDSILDLSMLNRDPAKMIYVSGYAFETCFQPENCVPIKPYKIEADDTTLLDLIPFLEYVARNRPADIRTFLASYERKDVAKEFANRALNQRQQNLSSSGVVKDSVI